MKNEPLKNYKHNDNVDVIVIGAGPVGLTASLLLSHFGIHHLLVEQRIGPKDHPQAHFISCRSMEIYRELGEVGRKIQHLSPPLDEWKRYIYCTSIAGLPDKPDNIGSQQSSLLGAVDHFQDRLEEHLSPSSECNLPQHDLEKLLIDAAKQSPFCRILEGQRASVAESSGEAKLTITDIRTDQSVMKKCRYVICADGAHSDIRSQLGIRRIRKTGVLQHLINVHFTSQQLSDIIRRSLAGMLYFIYSPQAIGVIVNHSLKHGEFVLQLPYFPPHQQAEEFEEARCMSIIHELVGRPVFVDILSIRSWRLSAWNAEKYCSSDGRYFLVGDAAHQMLPAGGFGLNSGIADVHNLIWKISLALRMENKNRKELIAPLLSSYERERRSAAEQFIATSIKNYQITTAVPSALGLEPQAIKLLNLGVRLTPLPQFFRRKIFNTAIRIGLAQVKLLEKDNIVNYFRRKDLSELFSDPHKTLAMRFPQLDLGFVYKTGFIEKSNSMATDSEHPGSFHPQLIVGQRLPHFWLYSKDSPPGEKYSSLDLASTITEEHERPFYVLLYYGIAHQEAKVFTEKLQKNYDPLKRVYLSDYRTHSFDTAFTFNDARPLFLPSKFAVLIRPDSHIAWLVTG